jgi:hypothetical protein
MHSPHAVSQDGYADDGPPPFMIIDLPPLCDEAALEFSELLQELSDQFTEFYERQIARAHYRRQRDESKRDRELKFRAAQMTLPIFDDETESQPEFDDPIEF